MPPLSPPQTACGLVCVGDPVLGGVFSACSCTMIYFALAEVAKTCPALSALFALSFCHVALVVLVALFPKAYSCAFYISSNSDTATTPFIFSTTLLTFLLLSFKNLRETFEAIDTLPCLFGSSNRPIICSYSKSHH